MYFLAKSLNSHSMFIYFENQVLVGDCYDKGDVINNFVVLKKLVTKKAKVKKIFKIIITKKIA